MSKLLYIKISEQIMKQILSGELQPGDKVPSVREYALKLNVNPKTIQKAFTYLSDKQIFDTQIGEGRYITKNKQILEQIKKKVIEEEVKIFIEKMKNLNYSFEEIIQLLREVDYE